MTLATQQPNALSSPPLPHTLPWTATPSPPPHTRPTHRAVVLLHEQLRRERHLQPQEPRRRAVAHEQRAALAAVVLKGAALERRLDAAEYRVRVGVRQHRVDLVGRRLDLSM